MLRNFLTAVAAFSISILLTAPAIAASPLADNPFFAMCTGTKDATHDTPESQVALVKELGYSGTDLIGVAGLAKVLEEIDRQESRFFALYTGANIDPVAVPWEEGLEEAMELLRGRDAVLWMPLSSKVYKPSSPEGDDAAVALLRRLSDMASAKGLRIALYPHTGNWVERVEDAVRVAKKVDRSNVGVTFNLCHWLKVDGEDLPARLALAEPYLFMVTVNGADSDGKEWKQLIQPLGQGSYDIAPLLRQLEVMNYRGPIGLQGYGIGGDVAANLRQSKTAWELLCAR